MEKNRSFKVMSIVALLVGVVGLTLGFAAFTNTLTISPGAEVKPAGTTFNVDFSAVDGSVDTTDITPTVDPTTLKATAAKIDNTNNPTITGLSATFTEPGQSAKYEFYAHNAGEYVAYLKSITFANVTGETSSKKCEPKEGTTASYVTSACTDISVSIQVGTEAATTGSVSGITNHSLAKNTSEKITVIISYAKKDNQVLADGDFTVTFGDITLGYSSVN